MKFYKLSILFIALFFVTDSHSMKRDRDYYEKTERVKEKETEDDKSLTKKNKLDESIDSSDSAEDSIEINEENVELSAFDQETDEHVLPIELIEHIIFLCMVSIFEDSIDMLRNSDPNYDESMLLTESMPLSSPISSDPTFKIWKENRPYEKMIKLLRVFPVNSIYRGLIASSAFKRNLSQHIKITLINFFKFNDNWASKFLTDLVCSTQVSRTQDPRHLKDVRLFARCLAESGLRPNQNCYSCIDGQRLEIPRMSEDQPFNLLEFAICFDDYTLLRFLMDEKGGDVTQVSKTLDCLTLPCMNDSIRMLELISENEINWDNEPILQASVKAIKNKAFKVIAFFVRASIDTNDIELLKSLIDNGLDVNRPNFNVWYHKDTEISSEETPLAVAIDTDNFGVVKKLIEEWEAAVNIKNSEGQTALFMCAEYYNHDHDKSVQVAEYLIAKGAIVNLEDLRGDTILHLAAEHNNVKLLRLFISDYGLDVNATNNKGETPLKIAIICGSIKAGILLIESGANVNIRDNEGKSLLSHCCFEVCGSEKVIALARFMIEKGANIFETINNPCEQNLLHRAIFNRRLKAVIFLVEFGFDINKPDGKGNTPLMIAKIHKYKEIQEYLEEKINSNSRTAE